ncbi:MAG: bifunctional glycosyltransferase/class I SAM-dependent methyltransferase [Phycisphaerales bacterium]
MTSQRADVPRPSFRKLSVLMPVFNEARTLRKIVQKVLESPVEELGLEIELIAVDDGSADSSRELLEELSRQDARVRVFFQERNRGKGAAIRRAIEECTGDIAIVQDSDLEYDPKDYPRVLAPILEGHADAVFGSRFAASEQRRVLLFWHSVANRFLTFVANALNNINLTDMETCYKAVRTDILKQIPLKSDRFGIEPELTTRLAQWNARLYEVPISYHGRTYAEGKNIGWKDGVQALWLLFKYRFLDRRFTTHDGYLVLESVRRARSFNRWTVSQFRSYVGDRVLEAGCGIGNFTEQLLDRERLVCADLDPYYTEIVDRRFSHLANVRTTHMDLGSAAEVHAIADERPDTVVSLNVVEHIEDDLGVLKNYFDVVQPGGHVIILVPAHEWLFSACDKAMGHHRRYTRAMIAERMKKAGFEVVETREFNRLGVLGWWINKKRGRRHISPVQTRVFNALLPLARLVERIDGLPGLSVIAIGRKPVRSPASPREGGGEDQAEASSLVELKPEARPVAVERP